MKNYLLFLLFSRCTPTEVPCHGGPVCFGRLSLEEPSELQEDAPETGRLYEAYPCASSHSEDLSYKNDHQRDIAGHDDEKPRKSIMAQATGASSLRPEAPPFKPLPHEGSKENVAVVPVKVNAATSELGGPTAFCHHHIPYFYPGNSNVGAEQYQQMPIEYSAYHGTPVPGNFVEANAATSEFGAPMAFYHHHVPHFPPRIPDTEVERYQQMPVEYSIYSTYQGAPGLNNPLEANAATSVLGAPTALYHHHVPHFFPRNSEVGVRRYQQMPIQEVDTLSRVSKGFPKAVELQIWFKKKVIEDGRTRHPHGPCGGHASRPRFVTQILEFRHAYKPFHGMPGIMGNQALKHGIRATFEFGRQGLNAYFQNNPYRIAELRNELMQRISEIVEYFTEDEVQKLFFWSVILSAAREWFYHEASKFARYLWSVKQTIPNLRAPEPRWYHSMNAGDDLQFDSLKAKRADELKVLGKILGYEEDDGKMGAWDNYMQVICSQGHYYKVNSRLEHTIGNLFKEAMDDMSKPTSDWIPGSRLASYCAKLGLPALELHYVVRAVRESSERRTEFTMGFELSAACLDHFSRVLVSLASSLAARIGIIDGAYSRKASGRILHKIFDHIMS